LVVIRRVAGSPSISGMWMSITTTSGFSARTCSSACVPVAPFPTTSALGRESCLSARSTAFRLFVGCRQWSAWQGL
jgi:hypothetical protein